MCESVVDFEASGLDPVRSYPIQVAWSMQDGTIESHYIIPEPGWDYWDNQAEVEVHGISREWLLECGKTANWVAKRMNECLAGCDVFWDGGDWDAFWLRRLYECVDETPKFYAGDFTKFVPEVPDEVRARLSSLAYEQAGPAHDASNDVRFLLLYREYANQYVNGKRIATEKEYDETLSKIDTLMNAERGTREGELLDKLVGIVEEYEDIYHPILGRHDLHKDLLPGSPVGKEFGGSDSDYD